ncbi:MAG TPA: hypothetical protein ENH82_08390 [bacterium]|nr:hypothetical protein [bacterium]
MTPKQRAWKWCSKFIRLRDALAYCKKVGIDPGLYEIEDLPIECCTCNRVRSFRQMDAGHFISRGSGGGSGVYFDERNVNTQCKSCNAFHQGAPLEYNDFMKEKYGQEVIDELRRKDKIIHRHASIEHRALAIYYKDAYEDLRHG